MPDGMVGVDLAKIEGFAEAMKAAPAVLVRELAKAFNIIARTDVETFQASLPSKLKVRSRGMPHVFRWVATDPDKATSIRKLFITEYTKWEAAGVLQTGGVIAPGKYMTVLTDAARDSSGRRKFKESELRDLVASGRARLIPTPRGFLLVESVGGLTKTGKPKAGSHDVILAVLRKRVTEKKKLDFLEQTERRASLHQDILQSAVENAQVEIAAAASNR